MTGECKCKDHYSQNTTDTSADLVCVPCADDELCTVCNVNSATFICSDCSENAKLVTSQDCACISGFYRNGSSCATCTVGCVDCDSENVCTECINSTNTDGVVTRSSP